MEEKLLIEEIKEKNSYKRFVHIIGVKHMCAALAMRYGYDVEKASICGLLHDVAKHYSDEKLLAKCEKYGIEVTSFEKAAPYLLHGKVGAYQACNKYGIDDEEILEAIRFHTTGKPNMSLIGKILFLADYIEPSRKNIPGLDDIRSLAFENIDEAVKAKLINMTSYLKGSKDIIDDMTEKTFDYYVKNGGNYDSKRND